MKNLCLLTFIALMAISCKNNNTAHHDQYNKDTIAIEALNQGNLEYNTYFTEKTMRVDYFHTGDSDSESFAIDRVLSDGDWAGSRKELIDKLELGLYFFEILDRETKVLLYSRGFASIFGEWQTIPEASEKKGTFHESFRFPWPKKPITLILKKRNTENRFQQIWNVDIDPSSRQVNKASRFSEDKINIISDNGPCHEKLDLLILGDGYSITEMVKFRNDAKRLSQVLVQTEPFKSRQKDINIRSIETPSMGSGVNKPHHGIYKRTPLSVSYSTFDSERYALSYDNRTIRDIASAAPYDFIIILINERTYGGGGIYNLYTTVSADNKFADYIMVHELGHGIAALADEYYTSSVSYEIPEIKIEPWETNVTALFDKDNLKWKDLVEVGTPIPTPWNKEEFDKFGYTIQKERDSIRANHLPEEIMEALFIKQYQAENAFFEKEKFQNSVGAFEGANYNAKGMYRSQLDCIMYTRHIHFCKVCQRSINQVIDQFAR